MDGSAKRAQGFESASEGTQCVAVHRCIRRVGGSLEQLCYKWGLAAIRKRLAYQYFRAESCFSGSETFSRIIKAPCVVSGHLQEGQGRFSVEVADGIKAPQRESSRQVYDSRWAIFQKWAQENQVDVTKPTIPQIADFFNHLFTDKNLNPRTIAGYRTSIADGLGSAGQMVSQSLDLNRLIASFHRDRPSANRAIPNWDLSLLLLVLTRPPFEPLAKADLKILAFKTVFLLALASGKRLSEIHAWTFDSFSRKSDWSEVTFSPSTAFIGKNQLAS